MVKLLAGPERTFAQGETLVIVSPLVIAHSPSSRSSFLPRGQISIKDEQLQSDGTWSSDEDELEKVFALLEQEGVAVDKTPSYFIVK